MEDNEECMRKNDSHLNEITDSGNEKLPDIVPCYYGVEMSISQELVKSGLGGLSVKHSTTNNSSKTPHEEKTTGGQEIQIQRRNSFWDIHRPELSKLNLSQKITHENVKKLLHSHVTEHGDFCTEMHSTPQSKTSSEKFKLVCMERMERTSCKGEHESVASNDIKRCVQLSDQDINNKFPIGKCKAKFCVTIGQYREKHQKKLTGKVQFSEDKTPAAGSSIVKDLVEEIALAATSKS